MADADAATAAADLEHQLFGSSDDDDASPSPAPAEASPPPSAPPPPAAAAPLGEPLDLVAPLVPARPRRGDLRLLRLGKLPGLDATPFDPATFVPPPPADPSPAAAAEAAVRALATVRHRVTPAGALESNARVVEWDDGSVHVVVGSEAYAVTDAPLGGPADGPAAPRAYLAARHAAVVQVVAPLRARWALAPADLKSSAHRRLAAAVDARHARGAKVQAATLLVDPAAAKRAREEEEEARIRERAGLAKKQRAARKGGAGSGPRVRRMDRLSAAYLEADDAVDSDEEEAEEGEAGVGARERARAALRRPEGDAAGAARLTAAKAGEEEEDDEDDGDFIADEDDDGGGDRGRAASSGEDDDDDAPAPAAAPKKAARLVLSDDDE